MAEDDPSGRVLEIAEPEATLPPAEETADSLLDQLSGIQSTLDRERAAAPELIAELLSLSPEYREEQLRREIRFHTWGVCELLLARSTEASDAPESAHLAALTLAGADRLDPARHAASVVADLKAQAWAAAGDANRQLGELSRAEADLRAAAACLAQGTGDLLVEARLLEFEGALRREQGRTGEAAALLKMAAARYRESGETQLLERALAEREAILRPEGSI